MTAAVPGLRVRVWVTDVWDMVELTLTPDTTVAHLKAAALEAATGRRAAAERYVVKYRGGLVDDGRTLAELGVREGAPFIVLPGRRQPVR
jgi:hypothetical protein